MFKVKLLLLLLIWRRAWGFVACVQKRPHRTLSAAAVEEDLSLSELTERISSVGANELELLSLLNEARSLPFFSLYSMDMLANCAYIEGGPDECEFDSCEILPVEPPPDALMKRDLRDTHFELDSWARMDPPTADYYDLAEYPEGYTGYDGSHVWRFVYENLCFGDDPTVVDDDDWRNVFDRAVSGMHASISCHVAEGMETEDDDRCQAEFERRVGSHPARVKNMHFVFAVVLTALSEAKLSLQNYDYAATGNPEALSKTQDVASRIAAQSLLDNDDLKKVAASLRESGAMANECVLASNDEKQFLEEAGIWQMRQRSRAMLRLMDCVGCGVCRLHGKVTWFGIATAFKLIYSFDRRANKPLARIEVAALVTALEKLASSVRFAAEMSAEENE